MGGNWILQNEHFVDQRAGDVGMAIRYTCLEGRADEGQRRGVK